MSKAKARVFVPLIKVDEEQRLVYGRITQEMLDKSGEVMDYATSKPLFEKWSSEIETNSNGLSKGNVRVMHGLTAAGKLTELEFNDDDQAIDVCAKIVDDKEWEKVTEGVYTGFSVGGKYAKRWTEEINGAKVKKFTAEPNEVSIVDNPCVPSACFSMFKADGSEIEVAFQVENDDEAWPGFAKANEVKEETAEPATPVEKAIASLTTEPTSEQVAAKAEELAKAAADGSTWMSHIETARAELMKGDSALSLAAEQEREKKENGEQAPEGETASEASESTDEGVEDKEAGDDDAVSEKVTPPGVKQGWLTSDGQSFDKKADAVAHEEALLKAGEPQTEAQKLAARLAKATSEEEPAAEVSVLDDYDRLGKALDAIRTPFENGEPKLEKGMYTVSSFSTLLCDMARLAKRIGGEGKGEGDDATDNSVSADLKKAAADLSESFKKYVSDQVDELLASIDDDTVGCCYDYFCCAAKEDGENQLAKDVCSLLEERKDSSRERRETLAKTFGYDGEVEETDETLSPPMQKRFDALESENAELKKVAEDAVSKVEELAKRVQAVEDTPLPRAPKNVVLRPGDGTFLGKTATTEEEKVAVLHDLIKSKGAEGVALDLIKLSQQNPIHLNLNPR